jgi:hypothetical protein
MESRHFFRENDKVQHRDGFMGVVVDSYALYAIIEWADGTTREVDQFDDHVTVVERAEAR